MLNALFTMIPKFFEWLSTTYIVPNVSLMTFIVSTFILSIVIYVVLPFGGDDD